MSDRSVRWWTLAVLAALGLYGYTHLRVTNSITHFIPSRAEAELVELSLELVESPLARKMVLSVEGGAASAEVATALAERLRGHEEIAWVEAGLTEDALRGLHELYFDRRVYLASDRPDIELAARLEPEALEREARTLRHRLAQPGAALLTRTAPADPLGLFERILERIIAFRPLAAGADHDDTPEHAVLQIGLVSSPFDSPRQTALLAFIESEFEMLRADRAAGLRLEMSGANRFAVASEKGIRRDGNVISMVSITAVSALFLLVFRSLRSLAIAILTPIGGFAAALALGLYSEQIVHGITLGFGFILLGVAIDYPIHLMNHHALDGAGATARESVGRIRSSLLLSGLTTTLAFLSLSLSSFPGLGDMGRFAAVGVPVSLGLTVLCLPAFLTASRGPTRAQRWLRDFFERLVERLGRRPVLPAAVLAGFAAVVAAGLPQLRWQDDPSSLMPLDPVLLAESERVRKRLVDFDGGRFVVSLAPTAQQALASSDVVAQRLASAVESGHLEGIGSLHTFLWSEELQRRNLDVFRAVPGLGERIDRAFSSQGFRPGAFRDFDEAIRSPAAPPLRPEDLAGTPLARVLDSLVELDGRWAAVTFLRGVHSGDGVTGALEGLEGVHYVAQKEIMADVYAGYRRSTVQMVALGAFVVFLVLQIRYRNPRRGLLAFVPASLAALATLGLFGIAGVRVSVVSAISLLVVLGMGVDYGIFAVDGARRRAHRGTTLSSLTVSCLTSVFVFGILALSSQPVLRAIGLTTGVGVLLALVLAPIVLALAQRLEAR